MSRRDDLEFLKIQQTILQMEEDVKAWCPSSGENVGRMIESPGSDEWYIECPSIPAAHDLRAAYAETMKPTSGTSASAPASPCPALSKTASRTPSRTAAGTMTAPRQCCCSTPGANRVTASSG